jgi:PIN domain nuclease of toxin-antitoxin system
MVEQAAAEDRLFASAASVWEIALKAAKGELLVGTDLSHWVTAQEVSPGVRLMAITPEITIESTQLPPWVRRRDRLVHRDPNDRFLVATARQMAAVLITVDEVILDYADDGHVVAYDARTR